MVRIYAIAAIALVPWIGFLVVAQPVDGVAHSYPWVVVGMVALVAASSFVASALLGRRSTEAAVVVGAAFCASLSFVALWFHIVGSPGHGRRLITTGFVLVVLPLALSVLDVARWMRRPAPSTPARRRAGAHLAVGVVATLFAVHLAFITPPSASVHHLRLLWTGLDIFELIGLATTALFLHRRSRWVRVSAPVTASLLIADAWTNVSSSAGWSRLAAVVMAMVELSLALLSIVVALRQVRREQRVHSRPRAGGERRVHPV